MKMRGGEIFKNRILKLNSLFIFVIRIEHDGSIYTPYHFLEISKKTGQYFDLQKIMIEKYF